jgi:3-methyladenine DNA glycosylase/8-oxoguanine DNA glycosylase
LQLRGPGGEPIDLRRTFTSHGVASLPPFFVDEEEPSLTVTLAFPRGKPRVTTVGPAPGNSAEVSVAGRALSPTAQGTTLAEVRRVLRFDEDLTGFYALAADDPELSWVGRGAGRMIRSQTVFEEVVKTICTTNCAWSATERMVGALVEHLGDPAVGAPLTGPRGRAFPTPQAMAEAGDDFYSDVVRAGYRGASLRNLARTVADGRLDLESLDAGHPANLDDDEVEACLLSIHGVGPYAAAHVMMMLGRYSPLILDSWTRPKYAKLMGRKQIADRMIQRRFRRYGSWAGLAFWLFLTQDWAD